MERLLQREPRRKFTVEEVGRMLDAGILTEDERVELLEGQLLVKTSQSPPHASTLHRLFERFQRAYPGHMVRPQFPLLASNESLPEPDVAVVAGGETTFQKRHPRADEAVIIVEVSWSTQQRDHAKARIYARGGAPVYWLLDLESRVLEVHDRPRADGVYARTVILDESDEVSLPDTDVVWKVAELLPSR